MGKATKAHRAKVQKRNKKVKQEEYTLKKKWNEAFQKQMEELKEKFAQMSGDTENIEDVVSEGTEKETTEISNYDTILEDGTKVQIAGFHNVGEND
jgi:predicted nuclease with TOPRIM domain